MNKTLLTLLILATPLAHAATNNDANAALLDNIARFSQYEQTAQQLSQGNTDLIPANAQQNRMPQSQIQPQVRLNSSAKTSDNSQGAQQVAPNASVYESVKILIQSGNLTDKQKINLISMLSA